MNQIISKAALALVIVLTLASCAVDEPMQPAMAKEVDVFGVLEDAVSKSTGFTISRVSAQPTDLKLILTMLGYAVIQGTSVETTQVKSLIEQLNRENSSYVELLLNSETPKLISCFQPDLALRSYADSQTRLEALVNLKRNEALFYVNGKPFAIVKLPGKSMEPLLDTLQGRVSLKELHPRSIRNLMLLRKNQSAWADANTENPEESKILQNAIKILMSAESIEILSVYYSYDYDVLPNSDSQIFGAVSISDYSTRVDIVEAVLCDFGTLRNACSPNPSHSIRAKSGNESVELCISYACHRAYLFVNGKQRAYFGLTGDSGALLTKILSLNHILTKDGYQAGHANVPRYIP